MSRLVLAPGLALLCTLGLLVSCDRGGSDSAQESAASRGPSGKAAVSPDDARAPNTLPDLVLSDPAGDTLDLAAIEGPVLVNLWATWCAPCVVEMPQLDTLAQRLDREVRVLTVSQDVRGSEVVAPFFAARGFNRLEPWLDPDGALLARFSDTGQLPLTVLFDARGREVLRVEGAYEWDSAEAAARVRAAVR